MPCHPARKLRQEEAHADAHPLEDPRGDCRQNRRAMLPSGACVRVRTYVGDAILELLHYVSTYVISTQAQ